MIYPATVEDYLTYIPVPIVKSSFFPSSVKTTMPANSRGLEGVEICSWKSFADTVCREREKALEPKSDDQLMPLIEKFKKITSCANESQVESELLRRLFDPLERLMYFLGFVGGFLPRPSDVILDPDYSWASAIVKENESAASNAGLVSKILIEVKTFWALDVPDDLVSIIKFDMSSPKAQAEESSFPAKPLNVDYQDPGKVTRAVSQIYGYMTVNHLAYGVVTTYDKFFFLRRVVGESGSRLEITDVIKLDQTRKTHEFTLMEAWLCLIKISEEDHLFSSPYPSPNPKQRVLESKRPMELVETAKIGNFNFGKIKTRCQLGTVVEGGLWGKDQRKSVMKVVDTSKSSKKTEKLKFEVSVYATLVSFQGSVIPRVQGFYLISRWILILVLSSCGKNITHKQFVKSYDHIQKMVKQIHKAGVAHGDLAFQNILLDTAGNVTIIDFSDAKLSSDCNEEKEFSIHCRNDLDVLELLLDRAKEDLQ